MDFFKNHLLGMFIFAVMTSIVAAYAYDFISSDQPKIVTKPYPLGTWSASCINGGWADDAQTIFAASCDKGKRNYNSSRIDMATCERNEVYNSYGYLKCGNG